MFVSRVASEKVSQKSGGGFNGEDAFKHDCKEANLFLLSEVEFIIFKINLLK